MRQINLALAEGSPIYLKGLEAVLSEEKQINIVIKAYTGRELMSKMLTKSVDVVLADTQLPGQNGLECLEEIRNKYPSVKVIMISIQEDVETIRRCMHLGASGYLSKGKEEKQIIMAIKDVFNRGNFIDEKLLNLLSEITTPDYFARIVFDNTGILLSPKDITIIQMMCQEMTSEDIAVYLNYSKRSIETYRNNIIKKIGCKNIAGVITFAVKNRLIYC